MFKGTIENRTIALKNKGSLRDVGAILQSVFKLLETRSPLVVRDISPGQDTLRYPGIHGPSKSNHL